MHHTFSQRLIILCLALILAGCDSLTEEADNSFIIGGRIFGLTGDNLILINNNDEEITIPAEAESFNFSQELSFGSTYEVKVKQNPSDPSQTCTITRGRGTVGNIDVTSIVVICETQSFFITGNVNVAHINNETQTIDFGSPLIIKNNGQDDQLIGKSGSFTFKGLDSRDIPYVDHSEYDITIHAMPNDPALDCSVDEGTGIVDGEDAQITINCVDVTPPSIDKTTPPDLSAESEVARGISRNATPLIYFSEAMADTSLTTDNIFINTITSSISLVDNPLVTVEPDSTLSGNTLFTVNVTTDVTDEAGNALQTNFSWDFKTADGLWETAESIENLDTTALTPQIAVDASGNMIVVWEQLEEGRYQIYANYKADSASWDPETAVAISNTTSGDTLNPKIAFNSAGNAMVVWEQYGAAHSGIWSNLYVAGTGWDGPVRVDPISSAGNAHSPQVLANSSNTFIALWSQEDSGIFNIYSNNYTTSWQSSATLVETVNNGNARTPRIALANSDNIYAVWSQSDGTNFNIQSARSTDNAVSWQDFGVVENNAGHAYNPYVAVDASENLFVTWEQDDGLDTNTWVNRYSASAWETAERLDATATEDAKNTSIAVDSSGNALATWQEFSEGYFNINAKLYTSGTGWGTIEQIDNAINANATNPQLIIDSTNKGLLIWIQEENDNYQLMASRYDTSDGWGSPEIISKTTTPTTSTPYIFKISDTLNKAAIVWAESETDDPFDIFFRIYQTP